MCIAELRPGGDATPWGQARVAPVCSGGGEGTGTTEGRRHNELGDDLQDVKDQLHDHRPLAQLARPAVDDGDEGAVQVAQVLRQQRLTITAGQVAHLQRTKRRRRRKDKVSFL